MKQLILIGLLLISMSTYCFAQLWSEQNSGVSVSLNSVSAINGYVWTCGINGTVLRTTNGGSNWLNSAGNIPSNITLLNIFCESDLIAVTAGNSNVQAVTYVFRTTNGGVNWTQVFSQNTGSINAVFLSSTGSSFMTGNPVSGRWSLWRSTDDGISWDSSGLYIPSPGYDSGFPNSLYKNGNEIWFGTSTSKVYYSSNNGANWVSQSISPDTTARAIWFLQSIYGLCGGTSMVKTTNAGSSWFPVTAPGSGNINGITGGLGDSKTWYIRGNTIYTSPNQGASWYIDYIAPAGTYNAISLVRDFPSRVWAVRSNGGISKYPGASTIINMNENDIPDKFQLLQNFPNPFNPTTKIKFQIPASPIPSQRVESSTEGGVNVKLVVYDILGREVASLIPPLRGGQEGLRPGTYEVEWDGSNYPSGVYFYKLTVDDASAPDGIGTGPLSITKKMVLIK